MIKLTNKIECFLKDTVGAISIIAAIVMPVMVLAICVGVDYSNSMQKKSQYQQQLDAILLHAIRKAGLEESTDAVAAALKAQIPNVSIENVALDTRDDGRIYLSANIIAPVSLRFGGVIGKDTHFLHLDSEVAAIKRISSVKFTPLSAKGLYPKMVELIVKPKQGSEQTLNRIYYKVNPLTRTCSNQGNIQVEHCDEVDLGDFEYAYLRFHVWEYEADGIDSNATAATIQINSNDPTNAYRFFIDGSQQSNGTAVNVFSTLSCDDSSHHAWEDQRHVSYSDSRDFIYEVQGFCKNIEPQDILLTR